MKNFQNVQIDDLKNIDFAQIQALIKRRFDIVLNVILVVLTVIISLVFISGPNQEIQNMKSLIDENQNKLTLKSELESLEKQYQQLVRDFPKSLDSDGLTKAIVNLAQRHNLNIRSLSPDRKVDEKYFAFFNLRVDLASQSYSDMGQFINGLENLGFAIIIENLDIRKEALARRTNEELLFNISMQIKTIVYKNEKK